MKWTIIFLVLVFFLLVMLQKKARISKQITSIDELKEQIDENLDQRFKTFADLINVMRKYMDVEKSTFREVGELKEKANQAQKEGDERSRIGDEDKISRHVEGISYAFEQHQDLKTDQDANNLFDQLVEHENKLAKMKEEFNQHVAHYENVKHSLFGSIVVFIFGYELNHEYEKWHVNADAFNGGDKYNVEL